MALSISPSPAQVEQMAMQHKWLQIEDRRRREVEPLAFCEIWVPRLYGKRPGEIGYKSKCVSLLANATGRTEGSIRSVWGKDFDGMPDDMKIVLNMVDMFWRSAYTGK